MTTSNMNSSFDIFSSYVYSAFSNHVTIRRRIRSDYIVHFLNVSLYNLRYIIYIFTLIYIPIYFVQLFTICLLLNVYIVLSDHAPWSKYCHEQLSKLHIKIMCFVVKLDSLLSC